MISRFVRLEWIDDHVIPAKSWLARRWCFALALPLLLGGCWSKTDLARPPIVGKNGQAESKATAESRPPRPSDDFVGSHVCASCHASISESYSQHPMAQSLAGVMDAKPLEDYENHTTIKPPGNRSYVIERRPDGVFHHEVGETADGIEIYDQSVPIHFAVGSGQRGRSYLTNRDGQLFMSPLTWYSGSQAWDLSPGYRPESHQRFDRQVSDGCLACHAGRMATQAGSPNSYDAHHPFLEETIGCERCHGPGASHVARYQKADPDLVDRIVNPAKLDTVRRDAVCNQCHLQGGRRVLRYGREEFDFRPGDRLSDVWIVSLEPEKVSPGDAARAVTQSQQMQESACFQKSQRLGCISCHDPHRHPKPEERHAFYDGRCATCHGQSSPICAKSPSLREAKSCVECHMPRFSTSDVPHTVQTDHRISRSGPVTKQRGLLRPKGEIVIYHEGAPPLPDWEIQRGRGILASELAQRQADNQRGSEAIASLRPLQARLPDDTELLNALGTAYLQQQNSSEAVKCWELALKLAPNHTAALESLAVFHHQSGNLSEASRHYSRLIEANPWRPENFGRYAHVLGQLGELDAAIAAGEKCAELNPTLAHVHAWLAEIYQRHGQLEQSRKHQELFRQLDPQRK